MTPGGMLLKVCGRFNQSDPLQYTLHERSGPYNNNIYICGGVMLTPLPHPRPQILPHSRDRLSPSVARDHVRLFPTQLLAGKKVR